MSLSVEIKDFDGYTIAIIRLPKTYRVLSSAVIGGGTMSTDALLICQVPMGYDNPRPEEDLLRVIAGLGIQQCTGFMTAADVKKVITVCTETVNGAKATAVVTAGVSNAVMAGDRLPQEVVDSLSSHRAGTINTIAISEVPLQDCAMANALMTITEAKAAALRDVGLVATGTTSDAVAIAAPDGPGERYAGTATDVGMAIARAVRSAVYQSTKKWYKKARPRDFLLRLEEIGVGREEMWESAVSLYFPNPDWSFDDLKERFFCQLEVLRQDVNVNSMILAAMAIEDIGKQDGIRGLDQGTFVQDPAHLVADEMMGIALAEYIAGTKGHCEYTRYDREKPGVLAQLGPFLDDIVASLIGSIMSRIYTQLLENEGKLA